ncbi:DedA family protein [Marinimicrococcus flavescens]|uniref:DedA family protein n=1 Tax=Marinimicrococcus flavescens TaxID=3031815 RepID=A0AAP4D6S1_9PROT|nr:DedA family protein [Marinimicrococcus flavescens]
MFDWITGFVEQSGYLGIAFLMLAENVFPPVPSELIMPLAGYTAASGKLNMAGVVAAGTAGSLAGALFWYYVGLKIGMDRLRRWAGRHGRWLTLHPDELDRAKAMFERHSGTAVFVGRLVPALRTLISVPAGVACMGLARFLLFSTLGTAIWTALLAGAGYLLEDQYQKVAEWMNPATNTILALMLAYYVYRVVTFRGRSAG